MTPELLNQFAAIVGEKHAIRDVAGMVGELLQRAERAEPAAKQPTAPEKKAKDRHSPDQQRERTIEQVGEARAVERRPQRRKRCHDRQLPLTPPADESRDGGKDRQADGRQDRLPRDPALAGAEQGDRRHQQDADGDQVTLPVPDRLAPGRKPPDRFGAEEETLGRRGCQAEMGGSDLGLEHPVFAHGLNGHCPIAGRVEAQPPIGAQDHRRPFGHAGKRLEQ